MTTPDISDKTFNFVMLAGCTIYLTAAFLYLLITGLTRESYSTILALSVLLIKISEAKACS